MISDLDKYGLVALTVIVVLILFIAMNDLRDDGDPELKGISFDDGLAGGSETAQDEEVVLVLDTGGQAETAEPFDFLEEAVACPGEVPPASSADTASTQGVRTHKIQKGDTLSGVSQRYYGSSRFWSLIVEANPGINPKRLDVGQEIRIPTTFDRRQPETAPAGTAPGEVNKTPRSYRVEKGDTLGKIAQNFYGSSSAWQKILAANVNTIRDPKKLTVGLVIEIP